MSLVTPYPAPEWVHQSNLKSMAVSPLEYKASVDDNDGTSTAAMQFGTLVHLLVLGGAKPVVWSGDRRGKAWEGFRGAQPEGTDIYTEKEHARALECAAAVVAHPIAGPMVLSPTALKEQACEWKYGTRKAAGRLDLIDPGVHLLDLKTTRAKTPEQFIRQAHSLGYLAQMAWYFDGAVQLGFDVPCARIVAVQSTRPFDVFVWKLTDRALEHGRKSIALWMGTLATCEAADQWPGGAQSELDLDAPDDGELEWDDDEESEAAE